MNNFIKGIVVFVVLVVFMGVAGVAEEITLTTYYPAPYGAYKEFTTTEKTCLATSSGNVGIGTTAPTQKLEATGPGLFGIQNVNETLIGMSVNTTGHEGVSLYHDGSEAFLTSVDAATVWQDITLQAANVRFDMNGSTNNVIINSSGRVGIGTTNPNYPLDVVGDINTTGDIHKNGMAYDNPDYVFEAGYKLMPLSELKGYLETNKHLPNLPSTEEIKNEDVKIFEQSRLILEKLEEAYLYIIELEQRIKKLEGR